MIVIAKTVFIAHPNPRKVFVSGSQNKTGRDICVKLEYVNESSVNTCRDIFAKVTRRSGQKNRKCVLQGLLIVNLSNTRPIGQ